MVSFGTMLFYKPVLTHSITLMTAVCTNFGKFLIKGTKANLKKIKGYLDEPLMRVTALCPLIGYDKASKISHYANGDSS